MRIDYRICVLLLMISFSISCATLDKKPLPSPVKGAESAAFAVDIDLKVKNIIGLSGEEYPVYCYMAKVKNGSVLSKDVIAAEIIHQDTAYFLNVEPGEYALCGLVYKTKITSNFNKGGGIGYQPDIVKIFTVLLNEDSMKKTIIKAESGKLVYVGRFSISAESKPEEDVLEFYEPVLSSVQIRAGDPRSVVKADAYKGSEYKKTILTDKTEARFKKTARVDLKGSGWESFLDTKPVEAPAVVEEKKEVQNNQ